MKENEELLQRAKDRWKLAVKAHHRQYERSESDTAFCDPDNQWPSNIKAMRGDKPCLTVDVLTPIIKQVVNEQRQNRPSVRVSPVDDYSDKETAEVLQGIIRHIEYNSDADVAYDRACEAQVRGGIGFLRVTTEYCDPTSWDQDIKILSVPNWAMVHLDPSSQAPDGSDAAWGFIAEDFTEDEYKVAFPDSKLAGMGSGDWKGVADESPDWMNGGDARAVRVVEYFEKVFKKATLYKLADGSTTTELAEGQKSVDSRKVELPSVKWYKLNAVEVLEETDWECEWLPIIPVYGDELVINGEKNYFGLVHRAKDVQKMINVWKSVQTETIGLTSKAPWIASIEAMAGHEEVWKTANVRDWNALPWNAYDEQGRTIPQPQRDVQEPAIQAITLALNGSMNDIKAVTGMYDPNLGVRDSASQSGIAIRNLQHQGQVGNYHFQDNLARSIKHLGRILIQLIRKYYDTSRIVRVIGIDESQKLVRVNGGDGEQVPEGQDRIYDLKTGRYDVTCSVGPSYTSKRQENLATLLDFQKGLMPEQAALISDLIASQVDAPIAEEVARRLKMTLPPQFQEDKGQPQIPPQVMAQVQGMKQTLDAMTQQHDALVAKINELNAQLEDESAKLAADVEKARIQAAGRVEESTIQAEAEIRKAQIAAGGSDELAAYLQELADKQAAMEALVLEMHDAAVAPAMEEIEPAIPAGDVTAGSMVGMEESNE